MMCFLTQLYKLNILSALSLPDIIVMIVLGVMIIVAFLAFRVNYRAQMRVSVYMDLEANVYSEKGLEVYLEKKRKKLSNPALVVVQLQNLSLLYNEYQDKELLMVTIANSLLKGLGKLETVARIEFDKFSILYENKTREDLRDLCIKIENRLADIYFDSYGNYNFLIAFGVYPSVPLDNPKQAILLTAMTPQCSGIYEKNIYYYCDDVALKVEKMQRMNELKNSALEDGRFVPYIQPKVSFATGKVVGGEILTRWVDANFNPIFYPNEFVPLFESNGFVKEIDNLMLKHACMLAQTLVRRGHTDIVISLNFSKINFLSNTCVKDILDTISQYNISNSNIEIEITESTIINNSQLISDAIMHLRQAGVKIAMDDFGKDNSSLGSLSTNNFDAIKVDGIFFKDRLSTDKTKSIVENILNMLSKLKYEIVVECIEDRQTLDVLATINQDIIIQGYVISQPIPVSEFEPFVETQFEFDYPTIEEQRKANAPAPEVQIQYVQVPGEAPSQQTIVYQPGYDLNDLKQQIKDMQKTIDDQKMQAYEQEIKFMREQMEIMKTFHTAQANNNSNNNQQPVQPQKDVEIELLKKEIEVLKTQNSVQQQSGIDVEELILRLSQTQNEKIQLQIEKVNEEAKSLRETLERERKEREELEKLLLDIKNGEVEVEFTDSEDDLEVTDDDLAVADYDGSDSEDDDYDEDAEEVDEILNDLEMPKYSLKELEAIIEDYKAKYKDDWNIKAKEELKDGYYEVINGLKYYRGRIKVTFNDRIKNASEDVKKVYNSIKNEILQYSGIVNKTLNSYDAFYIGRNQIIKMSLTKTKVRVFLAVDPANYPPKQFPHKDVSHKKAHSKTPFLMMIKSNLSLKRVSKVISDIMTENNCMIDQSYKEVDYVSEMIKASKQ